MQVEIHKYTDVCSTNETKSESESESMLETTDKLGQSFFSFQPDIPCSTIATFTLKSQLTGWLAEKSVVGG